MVRLHRSAWGRLFGGTPAQWLVTLGLILLPLIGAAEHASAVKVIIVMAALVVPWIFGLTAHAEADEHGVRWRAFVRHEFSWDEVEAVARISNPYSISRVRDRLVLRVRGRNRVVWPASLVGPNLLPFAKQLAELAQQRGIPTDV